jgi:hypothetical protein
MTPLFSITLLAATLLPQLNLRSEALPQLEILLAKIKALPQMVIVQDIRPPAVVYFDAPPRPYGDVIRR